MALDPTLVDAVKRFEGFSARPFWDQKQYTSGYGTRASGPNEAAIDQNTAHARLTDALARAQVQVDTNFPGIPAGPRNALISLTYNAGPAWMTSGLGAQVRQGDFAGAKAKLLEYNKAGGEVNPGLVNRRRQEASWFDQEQPPRPPADIPNPGASPWPAPVATGAVPQAPSPAGPGMLAGSDIGASAPLPGLLASAPPAMAMAPPPAPQPLARPIFRPDPARLQAAALGVPPTGQPFDLAGLFGTGMNATDLQNWYSRQNPTG